MEFRNSIAILKELASIYSEGGDADLAEAINSLLFELARVTQVADVERGKSLVSEEEIVRLNNEIVEMNMKRPIALKGAPHLCSLVCPTWLGWCHCTVDVLLYNVKRAEIAEKDSYYDRRRGH